ncbi:MAG TPA: ABC transporter substrate-binding protein [Acidimicrobiales bacterium]|nr:ABC transporter substrate-binding protein [Acidimicrobiales bacterium]
MTLPAGGRSGPRRRRGLGWFGPLAALSVLAAVGYPTAPAGATGGLTASAPGVTPTTITIGYPVAETGVAATTFQDAPAGAMARVAYQNAHGGVDGRKLVLDVVNDESSPNLVLSSAEDLVSRGVFGVIGFDAFTYMAAPYLHAQGVPVTGWTVDGLEWGKQPYTNMFDYAGEFDPHFPVNSYDGTFMKSLGVTRLAVLAYNLSPISTAAATGFALSAKRAGVAVPYENLSVPFGTSDFSSIALTMKSEHINGVYAGMLEGSNIGLLTAIRQAGIPMKGVLLPTGYGEQLVSQPATNQAAQGAYFSDYTVPIWDHTAATVAWTKALAKYAPGSYQLGQVPDFGLFGGWITVDLMIYGLEHAGKNPTRASFEKALDATTDYTGGGLLPGPANFTHFGQAAPYGCAVFEKLTGKHFDPVKVCGHILPHSNQN